ncbi:gephyrin-like molybdotransferase receptor GlpR [Mycolicibacterium sp.]|uniref:divisome protein SepX/GlpR n=1 Tax=Mycolicibacterium sp. TaxID=2320850 RepID=UPI001D39F1C1|nr:gephyrin-like molybdotransferase receptor GlpR [Mycolicibacterium sp.]MCB1292221.1 hypothetical protein [Mycobacterium sp.]MCB9410333.1 hypothetical protein [Mycolicibacterium sp.]
MPSIPQSLLWISLVVLWLFVLVPMLINKRDTVRRTSDVALATRVLNRGMKSRLIRRGGPAAGHRHDPDWRPEDDFAEQDFAIQDEVADYDDAVRASRLRTHTRSVMVVAAVTEQSRTEPDYLDVDVVDENSGALPVGGGVQEALFDAEPERAEPEPHVSRGAPREDLAAAVDEVAVEEIAVEEVAVDEVAVEVGTRAEVESDVEGEAAAPETDAEGVSAAGSPDPAADEYEYIDDTSGLEAEEEPVVPVAPRASRQRRLESSTAAAVSARKYRFRKRMLTAMSAAMLLTAVLSFTVSSSLWWTCGVTAGITVLYLAYLRRQTRIEEQVRRRRQQRASRMRAAEFDDLEERKAEVGVTDFPTRLRRPGTVVLDIDDEDPVFEHLDEMAYSRSYDPHDLPRAAGQ